MDWSKAKTILIIALLIVCLILSGILVKERLTERKALEEAIAETKIYLQSQGIKLESDIPLDRPSLPVLFVEYQENTGSDELSYGDYMVYTASGSSKGYTIKSEGESKAKVISANTALLSAVLSKIEAGKELTITKVELVYYIDAETYQGMPASSDTAIPAWRIETKDGDFYINAYAN